MSNLIKQCSVQETLNTQTCNINYEGFTTFEELINIVIKDTKVNTNLISDGYHTFGELYEHRIALWIALCRVYSELATHTGYEVWKTRVHSDNSVWEGWFILGITAKGKQLTYHLPDSKWDECDFEPIEKAPEYDGHTPEDVLERIKNL